MDKQDWFDVGAQIGDLVQSAIDNKDFRQLNQSITDTINSAVEMVQKGVAGSVDINVRGGQYRSKKSAYQMAMEQVGQTAKRDVFSGDRLPVRTAGKGKAMALMGAGYGLAGFFGLALIGFSLANSVTGLFGAASLIVLILTLGFLYMGVKGSRLHARVKRQVQYLRIMGERDSCTIEELAAGTGKSKKYVAKDLKEMIQDGMFPDGAYLDTFETTLMTSHNAYQQYLDVTKQFEQRRQEEAREQEKQQKSGNTAQLSQEVQDILREGKAFIAHIHRANDAIEDKEISDKLDRLENVVARIFDQVEKDPKSAPDLHKLMSYYLPITQKLVDAYEDLDRQEVAGQNIRKTKKEISDSLDTINGAFENLLDSFFQDTAWDISSDISVLRTMMAQDGLMKKDFAPGERVKTVAGDVIKEAQTAAQSGQQQTQTTAQPLGGSQAQTQSLQ